MPERDGAAVDVRPLAVEPELLLHRQVLAGERLVDLDQVHVLRARGPAASSALRDAGTGPMPMISGGTPGDAPGDDARQRLQARGAAPRPRPAMTSAAAPSTMPLALPAVTKPSLPNAGLSAARPSSVVSGRRWSSLLDARSSCRPCATSTGTISSLNTPRSRGGGRRLLAAQRVGVHVLAADAVPARQVVGGLRHVEAAVRVEQRDHQRVLELALAEAQARRARRG